MTAAKPSRIYHRFELLWHWLQALLVLMLLVTGFASRFPSLLPWNFTANIGLHRHAGWVLIVLSLLAVFWHATTGMWRVYLPSEPLPRHRQMDNKLNSRQRWVYLIVELLLIPLLAITGLMYLYPDRFCALSTWLCSRASIADIHVLSAYILAAFAVVHVYLCVTSPHPLRSFKAMVTGFDQGDCEQ